MKLTSLTTMLLLFLSNPTLTWASNTQQLKSIKQAVEAFAIKSAKQRSSLPVEVQVGNIDPRLKLTKCKQPLETYHSPGSRGLGNILVGVRCSSPKPWSLYVPVEIKAYAEIPVASYSIPQGKILSAGDIELQKREISSLKRGYIGSSEQIIGMKTRRPISRGTPFTPMAIKAKIAVKKGQKITIIAKSNGIQVKAKGEAQRNGAIGDIIPIKNLRSKRTVDARITSSGTAEVNY